MLRSYSNLTQHPHPVDPYEPDTLCHDCGAFYTLSSILRSYPLSSPAVPTPWIPTHPILLATTAGHLTPFPLSFVANPIYPLPYPAVPTPWIPTHPILLATTAGRSPDQLMYGFIDVDVQLSRGFKERPTDTLSIIKSLLCRYLTILLQVTLVATDHLKM